MENINKNIIIYETKNKNIEIKTDMNNQTIWLSQSEMADLFDKDSDTIGLHIKNIFATNELSEKLTTEEFSVVRKEGVRKVKRTIKHYNLDVIISVGYRVSSKKGTQFRIWATNVLKQYLVHGYTLNQKVLEEQSQKFIDLQKYLKTLGNVAKNEDFTLETSKELMRIVSDYAQTINLLDKVDKNELIIPNSTNKTKSKILKYTTAKKEIDRLRIELDAGELFGNEKDSGFESALKAIFQTFNGKDLYPSIEEKAANLLYLIIKNHSFTDGNKRIGAFMFIRFLDINGLLYRANNSNLVEKNALVAIALLIAQSDPKDKDLMVNLVVNLITDLDK